MSRPPFRSWGTGLAFLLALGLQVTQAEADIDVGRLVSIYGSQLHARGGAASPLHALSRRDDGKMRLLVSGPSLPPAELNGLHELRSGLYAWTATPSQVSAFVGKHPKHRVTWSPPRKLLLDHAVSSVHADVAHNTYGLTGRGVVVGIVDTGVDVRHPDLRDAADHSRIAWLLDLSKQPTGKHPKLEQAFNCSNVDASCGIYSGADVDELLANSIAGDEPRDTYGHGTHVASLAVGNGSSNNPPRYVGMAPEATLVVVRATRDEEGYIQDADILLASQFIFAIAEQLGMPAVVNLSLGGDFGAHDGTSSIERELSNLVGSSYPGRSIVVAAGNSGMLYASPVAGYPEPLGIHATVQVPPYGSARVPVIVWRSAAPAIDSQVYLWVATRPGDDISVGLETDDSDWIEPVAIGDSATVEKAGLTGHVENGVSESDVPVDHYGAFVSIEGPFDRNTVVALKLKGHGTASIWLQPVGGIDRSANGYGVLMPGAQREGTITVPATAPALIAVGASLDRSGWVDVDGQPQNVVAELSRTQVEGEVVPFSSAGPNALDGIKPDLVAPGVYIVGAMSAITDPRSAAGENGMFAGGDVCSTASPNCLVVDDYHALSFGTSMASPVVAGAVALLFEKSPKLTQDEVLRLLQSGAKSINEYLVATHTQSGAGALDVEGALLALEDRALGSLVSSSRSSLTLGAAFIRPEPNWPVAGMVHLRDDKDQAVDVDVNRLHLRVHNGKVIAPLSRKGPGYYLFTLAGESNSGGQSLSLEVLVDGKVVVRQERLIAVDAPNVRRQAVAGRGCGVAPQSGRADGTLAWLGLLLAGWFRPLRRRVTHIQRG